jgi:hypothetical protein
MRPSRRRELAEPVHPHTVRTVAVAALVEHFEQLAGCVEAANADDHIDDRLAARPGMAVLPTWWIPPSITGGSAVAAGLARSRTARPVRVLRDDLDVLIRACPNRRRGIECAGYRAGRGRSCGDDDAVTHLQPESWWVRARFAVAPGRASVGSTSWHGPLAA